MLLPPANEVWGKVIFSQACVKNSVHRGGLPGPGGGGSWSRGGLLLLPGEWGVFRPTPKGEVEGDLAQARTQGGS